MTEVEMAARDLSRWVRVGHRHRGVRLVGMYAQRTAEDDARPTVVYEDDTPKPHARPAFGDRERVSVDTIRV